jgi:hypothetical protein
MTDIVERIEDALGQDTFWDTDAPPLLNDAVAEIKRLRIELSVQKACTVAGRDEIARLRLRLTDLAWAAIEDAIKALSEAFDLMDGWRGIVNNSHTPQPTGATEMREHWLEHAHGRILAGDDELDVLADYGWVQITAEEREAIDAAALACGNCNGFGGDPTRPAIYKGDKIAVTLRNLLERLHT